MHASSTHPNLLSEVLCLLFHLLKVRHGWSKGAQVVARGSQEVRRPAGSTSKWRTSREAGYLNSPSAVTPPGVGGVKVNEWRELWRGSRAVKRCLGVKRARSSLQPCLHKRQFREATSFFGKF